MNTSDKLTDTAQKGGNLKMQGMDIHYSCCFGDTVYYISEYDNTTIKEAIVKDFHSFPDATLYGVYDKEENCYLALDSDEVYFTREAAEKVIIGDI